MRASPVRDGAQVRRGYQPASQRTMSTIKALASQMPVGGARGKLKLARGKATLSQAELAKRAGVPISLIQHLEDGSAHLNEQTAKKLARALPNLEVEDLLSGSDTPVIDDLSAATGTLGATPDLHLPPGMTARFVPLLSYTQAGAPRSWSDDLYAHEGVLSMNVPPRAKAFALCIRGDSMEDHFHDGDNVIVQWGEEPHNGEIVVACLKSGEVMCKIYNSHSKGQKVVLSSYNPSHAPIPLERTEIRWVYPVIGMHRNFRRR